MSYSNGGPIALPSPTHPRHQDVANAVRSLRRSLSRSPSKFRLVAKSPSPSPNSPLSPPVPQRASSQPQRASSQPLLAPSNPPPTPSPLAVPFPPSAKLALRSSTRSKTAPIRPTSRRTSPKSPMKRVLSQASDNGNAPPSSSASSTGGQENSRSTSPAERKSFERVSKMGTFDSAPIHHALSRLGGDASNDFPTAANTSSPLKRSDAIMNLDQASLGSPVAKRRSLHGSASFGHDFNVFEHGPPSSPQFDIHDDLNQEYELSAASIGQENGSSFTSMPRRSSSLRKSTLQQRHGEKTSWGKRHAAQLLAAQQAALSLPEVSTPNPSKNRPRLSLDQFMPPMARDSPFCSQGNLPNPSMHLIGQPTHQPHPLSRTLTTSSSNSSIADESPTHIPVNFGAHPRPKLDFAKSLPPRPLHPFANQDLGHDLDESSYATPPNYKSVKPLPSAFMSTGLISKVNRNPEELRLPRGVSKTSVVMPDTPCKKQNNVFGTYPAGSPGKGLTKSRHLRQSFGTPSTPFNPLGGPTAPNTFGRPGVFGSSFGKIALPRRGSFLSINGDEDGSPSGKGDSQTSADFDLPPTPTKQAIDYLINESPSTHRQFPASAVGYGFAKSLPRTSSKLNLYTSPGNGDEYDSDTSMDINDSPTTANPQILHRSSTSGPFTGQSRAFRSPHSPTPSMSRSITAPLLSPSRKPGFAKLSHVAPASPLERLGYIERRPPQTPLDMLPPDPSGLSISNYRDGRTSSLGASTTTMPPPATPTTGRDYFSKIDNGLVSTTPVGNFAPAEVDTSLASRFEKAELIGTGEFSDVYRVTQLSTFAGNKSFFTATGSSRGGTPPTPMPERVFAVKKSRQSYQGIRDRQRKLQEVQVLQALRHSDHVVDFIDSWEHDDHLYIQTEFCEEGSLDMFLMQVGCRARLDDFRIWKILLELAQGLKHIHDLGYIHLDLKPANILVTFEGVLKIADFGLATPWPVESSIDGEGDREYIAPEILAGRYDKPADIFAIGIIMFEIASNVALPENGADWQRLRSGNIDMVPSLSWSASSMTRDASGMPVHGSDASLGYCVSDDEIVPHFGSPRLSSRKLDFGSSSKSLVHDSGNLFGSRRGELSNGPEFMRNKYHQHALDNVVRWMIAPAPQDRPTIQQVLETDGVQWVARRRRAGATVFEGNWGPADEVLADDAEMMDV